MERCSMPNARVSLLVIPSRRPSAVVLTKRSHARKRTSLFRCWTCWSSPRCALTLLEMHAVVTGAAVPRLRCMLQMVQGRLAYTTPLHQRTLFQPADYVQFTFRTVTLQVPRVIAVPQSSRRSKPSAVVAGRHPQPH